MENLSSCPVCNSNSFAPFIQCVDYTVSRETFQIVRCNNCSFKFTNPRPEQKEIGKYYESDDYISHSNSKKGLFNLAYQFVRNIALKNKLNLISSFESEGKTLLDIGCGTGEFLKTAKDAGWETIGLEPSENARAYASQKNHLTVYDLSHLQELQPKSFDIITMWHVLEHVPNLNEFIPQLRNLLKDSGRLIIAVPNSEAYEAGTYKSYWAAYDVPRHLNHFTIKTMSQLLSSHDMKLVKTIPMPFDAFYISMLSEKYKGAGLIKMGWNGLVNGLKSNSASRKDISKASSLIYVVRK